MNSNILTPDRRVRVFLSSRIPEFLEERKKLVQMIEKMGLTPIYFEEYPSEHPPRTLYSAYIAGSDIFIGIYGSGYGWIDSEGGMDISGIHDEWNLSSKIPRIVFIKDTNEPRDEKLDDLIATISTSGVSYNRFLKTQDLVNRVRAAIAICLTERFLSNESVHEPEPQNNLLQLSIDLEKNSLIATNFFETKIRPLLNTSQKIFISGSPGMGKTVSLYQISKYQSNSIYLSLRNQSVLSSLSYVANQLRVLCGEEPLRYTSSSVARDACEASLLKGSYTLLIDDVDQSPDVAQNLSTLPAGPGLIVFAGRVIMSAFLNDFDTIECGGFTDDESNQYINKSVSESSIQAQTAIQRSQGNPLYLRYYSESPRLEPPTSLHGFHSTMWRSLSSPQKEVLALLALSEVPLSSIRIAASLTHYRESHISPIASQDELETLGNLVSSANNNWRIFHPAFRDFICVQLKNNNLDESIHKTLAQIFSENTDIILRVIHSVRAGDADTVEDELLRAAAWADVTGRFLIAREVLASAIRLARKRRDWVVIGLALHQSADLKQHTRNIPSALLSANLAEKMLLRSKAKEAVRAARMSKSVFLLEVDRGDEAELILTSLAEECNSEGLSQAEATVRVNLAYIYIRRGRLASCYESCKKAEMLFEELGDRWGVAVAVLNMQGYYIAMYDRENQILTFKKLINLSKELNSPRLRVAAYNGMTIFYRREEKFEIAERVCLKGIALARSLGIWTVEAINTGNLGNVYRDQKLYGKARTCYETLIEMGKKRGSKHHLAMGKELIASIMEDENDIEGGIRIADEALILWREIGDRYREGATEDDQGRRYKKIGKLMQSGKSFERAADAWLQAGVPNSCRRRFSRAIRQYCKGGFFNEALACFEEAWRGLISYGFGEYALDLLKSLARSDIEILKLVDLNRISIDVCLMFDTPLERNTVIDTIASISIICKRIDSTPSKKVYFDFLKSRADACSRTTPRVQDIVTLALIIEQAPRSIIESVEITEVFSAITEGSSDFRYRRGANFEDCWTLIFSRSQAPVIEIRVVEPIPALRVTAAIIMILLWAKRGMLISHIGRRKWRRLALKFEMLSAEVAMTHDIPFPNWDPQEAPGVLCAWTDPKDESSSALPFFASEQISEYSDRNIHPDNKCIIWMMMIFYDGILDGFTHSKIPKNEKSELLRILISDLFSLDSLAKDEKLANEEIEIINEDDIS